ncbi:MAG: SGNH/GDSL hydrolase family protein, partial [Candidatus Nitrosopelagicus sp.]|nr:SGNH/GDSL hydrolase family protein [Candidatus Nitrosopelagicus sp.]
MSVQVGYKKQFLLYILLFLILIVTIESIVRIYDYSYPSCSFFDSDAFIEVDDDLKRTICHDNGKLKWSLTPLRLESDQHFETININSDGFRGPELQENPDYRIFVVGGSTTFGVGATSDNHTIPGYLQKFYNEQFPDMNIEVINAGIPKAYSFTEAELIKNSLVNHNPDLIIVYDGWNDINHSYKQFEIIESTPTDELIRMINRSDYLTPKVIIQNYFNHQRTSTDVIEFDSSQISEKITLWKNKLEQICASGQINDFKTIIILQPLLGTGNKTLSDEEVYYYDHYDSKT